MPKSSSTAAFFDLGKSDKSIINGVAAGGILSIWMHDCDLQYYTANSVPAILLRAFTVNSVVIERTWFTCTTGVSSGVHAIHIESTNSLGPAPAINCIVRDCVFELPGGGAVQMLSCANSGIENCTVYDLGVTPNNPLFEIGKGSSGPASSNCWLRGVRSMVGTTLKPDCKIDTSVSAQSSFTIDHCAFKWLDGGNAMPSPSVLIIGSDITNFQNIAYTRLGASATGDITFGTTDGASKSYTLWRGYSGSGSDGYLNIDQNGSYIGAIHPDGSLYWGGTRGAPAFYLSQLGRLNTKKAIYPGTPAGADQLAAGLSAGSGAPSNANGSNGDFYFRSDGTAGANTVIYHKEAGSWVQVITT